MTPLKFIFIILLSCLLSGLFVGFFLIVFRKWTDKDLEKARNIEYESILKQKDMMEDFLDNAGIKRLHK